MHTQGKCITTRDFHHINANFLKRVYRFPLDLCVFWRLSPVTICVIITVFAQFCDVHGAAAAPPAQMWIIQGFNVSPLYF